MAFNYKPLWKLLIDRGMTKSQLSEELKIARSTMAKMSKGEYVAMEVLDRICKHFNCQLADIVEHVQNEK